MRDVVFSCDDRGAKFLRVTVYSLLSRYRGKEPVRVNVLEGFGGHSPESKTALAETVSRFSRVPVRYVNVESAVAPYADLIMNREGSRWNIFTWTPIFVPDLLPDATGNVVHLDIDMLLNDDISALFELNLDDDLIAAVAEYNRGGGEVESKIWSDGILPPEAERYFNTGTLVFNIEKCRKERTAQRIIDWYREHYTIADRIEQDAWNALFWQRTKLLPLRWNFHDRLVKIFAKRDVREKYWLGNPPKECLEAALNPAILHFWGPKKPWLKCHRPYRKLYHDAMLAVGQTPPPEPLFAAFHDFVAQHRLKAISSRLATYC